VRLPAVLVPALVLVALVMRPWRWRAFEIDALDRWEPTPRVVWRAALVIGSLLFWIVLTRFQSGEINAVDFTVYFDRPCFQTVHGRLLFIESSDEARFAYRNELADHAFWGMLPLCSAYALYPSPFWLLAISVIAIVLGAVHVLRIVQRVGGGGVLASASALALALNDNTARTLQYGFHPEVLYAWFVPWMIHAGLRGARMSFLAAALCCVLVKEDAFLPILGVAVALAFIRFRTMTWAERSLFLVLPTALALANLAVHYVWVVPILTGEDRPTHSYFWENYGPTPILALLGMAARPWRVLADTVTSGFLTRVIVPHLFLPLVGWRWMVGVVPIVVIYGAAAAAQMRGFGIYYAIVLVPFLVISASSGALTLARRLVTSPTHARLVAAGTILLGALLVGSSDRGYSLRPWKREIAAVPAAVAQLTDERVVLVQSGLYPHAGYDARIRLLTQEAVLDPRNAGAAVLLAGGVSAYPFQPHELGSLTTLSPIRQMPGGLLAVRLSGKQSTHAQLIAR